MISYELANNWVERKKDEIKEDFSNRNSTIKSDLTILDELNNELQYDLDSDMTIKDFNDLYLEMINDLIFICDSLQDVYIDRNEDIKTIEMFEEYKDCFISFLD
jgi:hypothetical protein